MQKARFIAIYGINNIGKTTHSKRLVSRLSGLGKKAVYIKYPVYSQKPTGPFLNKILRSRAKQKINEEELQLWFVLNRYQFQPRLQRMLAKGITVIAEDYVGTGIAWGTSKGASKHELENMNKFLVQPDLCILMDGERVLRAREKHHIHERNDVIAQKCQKAFRSLAKKHKWKSIIVDKDRDVTAMRLWKTIQTLD